MSFSSAGDFRVVLQQYKYGSHQIFCIIKILPDTVSFFEKEPETDFNWMTAARWTKLESALWRLFASLSNWDEDARKLKTQMLIDHIKVSVSSSEELLPAAQKLLQDEVLAQNDLGLEIELRYMSHEDKTIVDSQAKKRKHADRVKTTPLECSADNSKVKSAGSNTSSKKKSAAKVSNSEQTQPSEEPSVSKRPGSETTSRKRERRSISQGSHSVKDVPPTSTIEQTSSRSRTDKRTKSPTSRANSAEPKAERRSARSPVRPGRYNEFVLSDKVTRKVKQKRTDSDSSSEKGPSQSASNNKHKQTVANGNAAHSGSQNWKFEQLDGARINKAALKQLNDMLDIPKPRKVKILLLKDMDEATVLKTFEAYRIDFDRLFKEREHKYQTTSYMTIDHCHIMDILTKPIRDSMIKKLGEAYSKSGPHGSLVINGLLPLWIIRLFMDRYHLTQKEAVHQIADQLKYNTYLKALNNEPLSSDLEDL
ncbi:uncharacterized protein CG4951 [Drosophila novamexicana]|uniref:uncharacterized protein CG4951 n=1 Tax=Drosophila novamexicana TaxID=47314 RepID=UPI0011E5F0A1|nr:uncharacterized protein CG4951 [Drosophila novamexicana]